MMKNRIDRRAFANTLGMGTMGLLLLNSCSKSHPEIILHNATIYTSNPNQPVAQAIAISNGLIVAVGSNSDMLHLAGSSTRKIDVAGKTMTPGFIDAHSHPASSGNQHLRNVDCDLRSIAAIKDALKLQVDKTQAGKWISGFKYDDTKTAEGRYINRYDLDEITPDHPLF